MSKSYLEIEKMLKEYAQSNLLKKEKIKLPILPMLNEGEEVPLLFKSLNQGMLNRFSRGELVLPNFEESETVCIFTDYGGEAKSSEFFTYTVTLVAYNQLAFFEKTMNEIRGKYKLNIPLKEISFKDLRYGPVRDCLEDYLLAINNLVNGISFTLVVDKEIQSLAEENNKESKYLIAKILEERGFGSYKADVAEKVYRITNLTSYLVNLLVPNGKKIFWMSDQDATIETEDMHKKMGQLFNNAIYSFENVTYDRVVYAKPFPKEEGTLFLDLLSISDLIAGAVEHYLSRQKKTPSLNFQISKGADQILMWLANNGLAFKKLTYIIRYDNNLQAYSGGFIDFKLNKPIDNAKYVDIFL